jgi:hypothetical protein
MDGIEENLSANILNSSNRTSMALEISAKLNNLEEFKKLLAIHGPNINQKIESITWRFALFL